MIYTWRRKYKLLDKALIENENNRANALVDDALRITDVEADAQRSRVRADIRLKIAGKLNRSKWGEKVEVTVNQKIDIGPILLEASARMKSLISNGVETPRLPLLEAEIGEQSEE